MKTQHTPGPWSVHVDDTSPWFPRFYVTCRGIRSIAVVTGCGDSSLRDENEANAILVSAAPELLTMLDRVLSEYLVVDPTNGPVSLLTLEQARAVIAKAKGIS